VSEQWLTAADEFCAVRGVTPADEAIDNCILTRSICKMRISCLQLFQPHARFVSRRTLRVNAVDNVLAAGRRRLADKILVLARPVREPKAEGGKGVSAYDSIAMVCAYVA
jgi:hypothetical protein